MGDDGEQRAVTRRGAERHSFFLLADVMDEQGSAIGHLRVRNLSASGLMGDTKLVLEPQRLLTVELRGIGPVIGKVVWARGDRVGMAFDMPIEPQRALKPVGKVRR